VDYFGDVVESLADVGFTGGHLKIEQFANKS
jgi:hypothetical protein